MKTIFITGASSGFGKLAVEELLAAGHKVIAAVRGGRDRAKGIFPDWIDRPQLQIVDVDLTHAEQIAAAAREVERLSGGKLDVLVNNAGYGLFGMSEDITPRELREQFDVNFFAPVELTRQLTPALIAARGRIINLTSVVGLITLPVYAAYCASKYAFESMSESFHYELRPFGVQVAIIEPGGFKTDFATRSRKVAAQALLPSSRNHGRTSRFFKFLDAREKGLSDPRAVARLLRKVCEKDRIRLRYPIGLDARLAIITRKLLPDFLRVRVIEWMFRRVILGPV